MQKNVASQTGYFFVFDATTALPKSGDAANIVCYVSKDAGTVTAIASNSGVPTEVDATNAKGYYKISLSQAETNGDVLLFSGKSSTSNIVVVGAPATVFTTPANFAAQSIDSNGRVDVIKLAGTTQTARDIGASVLLSNGTGTGQLKLASGYVAMTWADIAAPTTVVALSGTTIATVTNQLTAAAIATGVWQDATAGDFTTASSIGKCLYIANVAPGGSGGHLISGSNAGTTTLGALTVTGATTYTGNVVLSDGLTISAPSTLNRAGVTVTGNGTGAALSATGGATGQGFLIAGGGTSGDGIKVTTTSGHGINLAPVGTSMHGMLITGGNGGTSDGLKLAAGTGGVGFRLDTLTSSGAVTFNSLATGAISATTITASGAVAFQSTFAVTTSTSLAALSCSTLTASGAVAFQSTFAVTGAVTFASTFATTGTTTFNALTVTNATTLTGAVSLGSTLGVTGATTLAALNTGAVGTGNVTITGTLSTSGTTTLNALTVTNALTVSGATTFTGAWTATNAGNNVTGVTASVAGTVTLAASQAFNNTGTWTGNIVGTLSTLTTYTGNTPQTGDSFALIGATGSGLTSLAPSATALSTAVWTAPPTGFLAATFPAAVSSLTQTQVTGGAYSVQSALCVLGDARIANLDAASSSLASATVAPTWYTAPVGSVDVGSINGIATTSVTTVNAVLGTATAGSTAAALATAQTGITTLLVGVNLNASQHVIVDSGTVTTLTNLPSVPANWLTAAGIADGAIDTATFAAGTTLPRVTLVDTITTYTGNTPQTGDSFALIGAAGAGLTALAPASTALSTATWTGALATSLETLAGHDPGSTLASASGVTAAAAAVPAAVAAYDIGNGRTVGYYLQGGVNAVTFAADGLTFTVYGTDDATPLYTGTSTRFATTVGGLRGIDPG